MASSPSASSIPTRHPETEVAVPSTSTYAPALPYYQIFINHRGPDVKNTLASSLYHLLVRLGFKVFLDKKEMEVGENITSQIKGAIRSASVHVAIFSPGYGESKWCLDELVLMRETGRTIIPVFYDVKPCDLKWTQGGKGLYAKALEDLATKKTDEGKPRYDSKTIENWRTALHDVAEISGFELETRNGDQGELMDKIAMKVQKELEKLRVQEESEKLFVTVVEYPSGVNEKVEDFEDFEKTVLLQQQQSGKPLVVGIVGMGGVGKTTVAKELSNKKRKSSLYSKYCFLSNENRDKNSLKRMLYLQLTGLDLGTDNIDEAKLKVHSKFQAFVILDGADHKDQVVAVLAFQTVLSLDSLILITSRDRDVLTHSGVQESLIYKLTGLSTKHSREVFCSNAFGQPHPRTGFESLVDEYLDACEGLPLSLNVLGASLRGKNAICEWKDGLKELQQKLPSEIERPLKISYDGLNPQEKEIFLDIVSFFIGEKRDMATRIWDGSGWKGRSALQSLQNKSLVEVDSENKIEVLHNHLRDMGRKVGREAASGSGRRQVQGREHIDDLLQQLYNDQVRGIRADRDHVSTEERGVRTACYHVSGHESKPSVKNTKLQLLDVEGADFDLALILKKLDPTNLLWLRWRNCSYSSLPKWVPMRNLRVLEVQSSILKNLWERKSQAPLKLRELVITSPLSKLPNSIGDLKDLELMELHCSEIKSLPYSFGYLARLEHIDLSGSKKLEKLPDSFDGLLSLKFINLRDCSEIKSLPDSLGNLTNLEHIDLSRSKNLERLPKNFGQLKSLKYLDLSRCNYLTIDSNTLGDIRELKYIDLSDCEKIKSLPPQVAHQQSLEILKGPFLQMVPSRLDGNLKELELWKGSKSKELEGLSIPSKFLTQLAKLKVNECVFPERSFPKNEAETGASTLKHVQLQHMELCKTEISEVSFAEGFCPNLRQLLINSCDRLEKVGTLPDALETLELTRCKELKKIEGLCGLEKLQKLKIKACRKLEELSSIEKLISLERLVVSECGKLKRIERLSQMTKLRRLDLSKCSELERLNISKCSELEELVVSECGKLKRIESLSQLTKLERLNLSKCSELEELPGVEHLMSLKSLVKECPKLQRSSPEISSGQSST